MQRLDGDDIVCTDARPEIRTYPKGGVLIFDGSIPNWVKTSTSGRWIFSELQQRPASVTELVDRTATHYDVPRDMVEGSVTDLLSALVEAGLARVTNRDLPDSRKALTEKYGNDHLLAAPLAYIFFNILSDCNLNCPYCFVHRHPHSAIPLERAKILIDQMAELQPRSVLLCGGEPFLHPQLLDIVRYLKERAGWSIRIITNGTAASDAVLREVAFLVDEMRVSFDGVTAEVHDVTRRKGSFDRSVAMLKKLWEWQAPALRGIALTPLPHNLHQVEHLYEFGASIHAQDIKMNVPHLMATPEREHELGEPRFSSFEFYESCLGHFDKLLTHYVRDVMRVTPEMDHPIAIDTTIDPSRDMLVTVRRTSCGAGCTTIFVNEVGDVYPCAAQSTCAPKMGNAFETPLKDLYFGACREYRRRVSVENIPQCAECSYRFMCAGGCRAKSDAPERPTPTCAFIKRRCDNFFQAVTRPVGPGTRKEPAETRTTEGELLCGS